MEFMESSSSAGPHGMNSVGEDHLGVLPGPELQEHFVNQPQGHKAMPWGLKSTLMEHRLGGQRAKTRMGTLKRTFMREGRRGKGRTVGPEAGPGPVKVEEEAQTELDSPSLPLIEISEVDGLEMGEIKDQTEAGSRSESEVAATGQAEADVKGTREEQSPGVVGQTEAATTSTPSLPPVHPTASTPKKRGLSRKSAPMQPSPASTLVDESTYSESSSQEAPGSVGSSRRPREAHKRLKITGGYYSKPSRHREERREGEGAATMDSSSRATSYAPEESPLTAVNGADPSLSPPSMAAKGGGRGATPASAAPTATLTGSLRRMTAAPLAQGSPSKLMHASGEAAQRDGSEGAGNNEFCETCRGVGHFICCDGCPRSFHFACINPPLDIDELPNSIGDENDTWFCNVCRAGKKPERGKNRAKPAMFAPLLQHADETNPSLFSLPLDVRNYFKGVATANDGSYVNSHMLRSIKVNKYGIVDEREPLKLKDKNGKPILCYCCGESAMPAESPERGEAKAKGRLSRAAAQVANAAVTSHAGEDDRQGWRKIISCDFCNLHWHLDCLSPPLASMPNLSRKWMCPNHIEHALPSERIAKSVANSTSVHELPLPSEDTIGPGKHYRARVVNDGQIDIIPDPMDTYAGPSSLDGKGGTSGDKGWEESAGIVPAYKGYPSVFGSQNNIRFRYRIPEKVIRLDFWTKAELNREAMAQGSRPKGEGRSRGLDLLSVVASAADEQGAAADRLHDEGRAGALSKTEAKNIVDTLFSHPVPATADESQEQEQEHPFVKPGEEPVSLLRQSYIPGEYEREFQGLPEPDAKAKRSQEDEDEDKRQSLARKATASTTASLDEKEAARLQAIRQLIEYKGRDALLRFLLD